MDLLRHQWLSILIFLPLAGVIPVLLVRGRNAVRWTALGITLGAVCAALPLFFNFAWHAPAQPMVGLSAGHILYFVAIDALSFPLVLLTVLIGPLVCAAAWKIQAQFKAFFALLLATETAFLGTFLAGDSALLYIFLQASAILTGVLIAFWGGGRRKSAAVKYALFMLASAAALFIVLLPGHGAANLQLLFLLAMVAFLIRMAGVPLHGWLADAHAQAAAPISMILAALMTTSGGYGIFRVAYPLFPEAAKAMWLVIAMTGLVSMFYGSLCAMAQCDLKRLIAYASIANLGFVTLGAAVLTPASINGAIFMLVAQAPTAAAMFFVAGIVENRLHHCDLSRLGELGESMPVLGGFASIAFFTALGIPGLCLFVGEILVLLGTFAACHDGSILYTQAAGQHDVSQFLLAVRLIAVAACFAGVLAAAYLPRTLRRIFSANEKSPSSGAGDLHEREIAVLTPLTILMILLGILPWPCFLMFTNQAMVNFLKLFSP